MNRRQLDSAARAWARNRKKEDNTRPEVEAREPARPASFTGDLLVPLAQALVTGCVAAGALIALGLEVGVAWGGAPLRAWAIAALLIVCASWLVLLGQTRRLLWKVETLTGLDLDGDGQRGKPSSGDRVVFLNAKGEPTPAPSPPPEPKPMGIAEFVGLLDVRGTGYRAWEKRLPRLVYQGYRDALIRAGWAAWRSVREDGTANTKQGWELIKRQDWILDRIQYLDDLD